MTNWQPSSNPTPTPGPNSVIIPAPPMTFTGRGGQPQQPDGPGSSNTGYNSEGPLSIFFYVAVLFLKIGSPTGHTNQIYLSHLLEEHYTVAAI